MTKERYPSDLVWQQVSKQLQHLLNHSNPAAVKAELAVMRRGVGQKPGDDPNLWGMLFQTLPEELENGRSAEPSRPEWAIYTALTLYALHQQGRDLTRENMNDPERSLGKSVAQLAIRTPDGLDAIRRRFNVMATSSDMEELTWHLRGVIQLLKKESIPLDYAGLAKNLYAYQAIERRASVRLQWGRDFFKTYNDYIRKQQAKEAEH